MVRVAPIRFVKKSPCIVDSNVILVPMGRDRVSVKLKQQSRSQAIALGALLVMSGIAIAGPSGIMAWSENLRLLDQRQKEFAQVQLQRNDLSNRVALLNPGNTDADLAGELLRRNLNVVHQDEMVMLIK